MPISLNDLPRHLQEKVEISRQMKATKADARIALSCFDLTSLTGQETQNDIISLCQSARLHHVFATCVFPDWVALAAQQLSTSHVRTATVINFPLGDKRTNQPEVKATIESTRQDIQSALMQGARQIDIVYAKTYPKEYATAILAAAKEKCTHHARLVTILETASYHTPDDLIRAGEVALDAGADMLKSSTGKYSLGGASLEAAAILFDLVERYNPQRGIKLAGGISTPDECAQYIALRALFSKPPPIHGENFRMGGSRPLKALCDLSQAPS